jgi:hypothetical protein
VCVCASVRGVRRGACHRLPLHWSMSFFCKVVCRSCVFAHAMSSPGAAGLSCGMFAAAAVAVAETNRGCWGRMAMRGSATGCWCVTAGGWPVWQCRPPILEIMSECLLHSELHAFASCCCRGAQTHTKLHQLFTNISGRCATKLNSQARLRKQPNTVRRRHMCTPASSLHVHDTHIMTGSCRAALPNGSIPALHAGDPPASLYTTQTCPLIVAAS